MIVLISLAVLALLLPTVLFDLFRSPTIRRLGLRNVTRRKGEAALVVGGSMLATALVAASFIIGTSFDQSIRGEAANRLGPVDEVVFLDDPDRLAEMAAAVRDLPGDDIDGVLLGTRTTVAVGVVGPDRRVEPSAALFEFDLAEARAFGGDPAATGLADLGPLGSDEIVINEKLANELEVGVGDRVEMFLGQSSATFTVGFVAPTSGLAGLADVIVPKGTFTGAVAAAGADLDGIAGSVVLVSNTGGVYEGVSLSDSVTTQLEEAATAAGISADVVDAKQFLLEVAETEGEAMTELFGTIGGFSVIAGILLVINLFVMLAGERKVELGTMRAVGIGRGQVLRAFALEGAVYGVLAAAVGALLGVAVAAGVMAFAATLFEGNQRGAFEVSLALRWQDLFTGALIGLAISQLTVTLTSYRMTRINIVRALKDLPEQAAVRPPRHRLVFGLLGMAAGAALYFLAGTNPLAVMLGPVFVALGAIPLLGLVLSPRLATAIGCGVGLIWPAAVFGLSDVMDDPEVSVFLLQGVLLVGLATVVLASMDKVWLTLAEWLTGGGIASKLGLAHPLDRPVRSALLVAMYALVLFTVTFMAVLNAVFQKSAPDLAFQAGGGYDLVVNSNRTAPLTSQELEARAAVASVSEIRRGSLEIRPDRADLESHDSWTVSAISENWQPDLAPFADSIDPTFQTQKEMWAAVASGAQVNGVYWIVAPDYSDYQVGQQMDLVSNDGSLVQIAVAGLTRNNWLANSGIYFPDAVAAQLYGDQRPVTRQLVDLVDGTDVELMIASLESDTPERGVEADSFIGLAKAELDQQEGFLRMLQGYLGLGLIIGIVGLGVVLVRAVRERRKELGMLKAIGVPTRQTQRAFLFEAAFIGLQGVVLGLGLGVLSAWQVLTKSDAFEEGLKFAVPVTWLVGFGALALLASVLAAVGPARSAGRILPAVALRATG